MDPGRILMNDGSALVVELTPPSIQLAWVDSEGAYQGGWRLSPEEADRLGVALLAMARLEDPGSPTLQAAVAKVGELVAAARARGAQAVQGGPLPPKTE